jgi:putative ABC transport system substrate-binding protein
MNRRAFVAGMTFATVARPRASEAQEGRRARIGWLTSSVVHHRNLDAFRDGMRALGHGDITVDIREARGATERLPALAAELVAGGVDVIVTDGGPALVAAQQATTRIPIVAGATAADLVRQGSVSSLARPGGNVTGFTISTGSELYGKRLELLREALPRLMRVGVVWNTRNRVSREALASVRSVAEAMRLTVVPLEIGETRDIEAVIAGATARRVDAVLTIADAFFWSERARIVGVVNRQRLPAIYPEPDYIQVGGLMAYGPNVPDNFRRAAGYVDRILKGASPGDLPVELPATFEFGINLKTARALGLTISPSLLLQANQVIE